MDKEELLIKGDKIFNKLSYLLCVNKMSEKAPIIQKLKKELKEVKQTLTQARQ